MTHDLPAEAYYDGPYGPGLHVVLLWLPDDLAEAAGRPYGRVSELVRAATFWRVEIGSERQAEAVQAVRYPQYRWFRDGAELASYVGVLDDDQLLDRFDHLGD